MPEFANDPKTHSMNYRFSGHETFSCRYAWLPKAVHAVKDDPAILSPAREDDAMVALGVGKNMVRSIRFWAETTGVIQLTGDGHDFTELGASIFIGEDEEPTAPLDPFLEDIQTLWLIHWKLSTSKKDPIYVWDYLINQYHEPEIHASGVINALKKSISTTFKKSVSDRSIVELWDVFLHSYVPSRSKKGEVKEDNLDCPLIELDLLRPIGETQSAINPGRWETKYAFRWEEKPEISPALFAYCLEDYWLARFGGKNVQEQSIPLHQIVSGRGSPGQVFKIPEWDIRSRLLGIENTTKGYFVFEESAAIPRVIRTSKGEVPSLDQVYAYEEAIV